MRIYLLDGDRESLARTARMLGDYPDVELVGSSYEPEAALSEALGLEPDALFVETRLGYISGLAASERLLRDLPGLRIVYVTASREYAVEAFEQRAFDYLLKPLTLERLERTIVRLRRSCGSVIHRQQERLDKVE
ncbi:LytR/AlgR family response regulator transcription factor [Saccharibacillus sacchari]|uniref:Response regulator n=1 Tax=Saccharibacillus sacchari TaxID=456493 RepID=A0ACC6PFB5_9BACL